MRFWTIWTLPVATLDEKLRRTRDWLAMGVAGRLPLRVRYWTALRELAYATRTSENVMATPLDDILQSLNRPKVTT